ncbi:MAG: hypothetical protein NXH70_02700 [Hyphomonas sp.]|nr:hypothetical protein [Hyphomonas sp.]
MFKSIRMGLAGLALLGGVAACGTINDGAEKIGLGVNFENVYQGADSFSSNAFVTVRLYEATLDSAIFACDPTVNEAAAETPLEVCEKAADAAERISPAVQAASRSIGVYIYLDNKVDAIRADGEVVPDEVLQAAGEAFFKARTEWMAIETDIQAYIAQ